MTDTHKIPTHTDNGRGYEASDANVSALTKFGVGLAIISAIVLVLMVWLLKFFISQNKDATPPASPLAVERQAPPAPRLQIAPEKDLHQVHVGEDSLLHSYGWVIRDAGVVRIPIERALELTAQRGLPVRAAEEAKIEGGESQIENRRTKIEDGGSQQ